MEHRQIEDLRDSIHAKVVSEAIGFCLPEAYKLVREWNKELIEEKMIKRYRTGRVLACKLTEHYGYSIDAINTAIKEVNKKAKRKEPSGN